MKSDGFYILFILKLFQFVTLNSITYIKFGANSLQMSMNTFVVIVVP